MCCNNFLVLTSILCYNKDCKIHYKTLGYIMQNTLKLATRGSKLALAQAEIVSKLLNNIGVSVELVIANTKGDLDQSSPLSKIGGNGLFSRCIENLLLEDKADIAVHSAKDLSINISPKLIIAATPEADSPFDVLVTLKDAVLPINAKIGTSSPRRAAQIKKLYPECEICEIRGNVDTRLNKLKDKQYDAIILAQAGLNRLKPSLTDFNLTLLDSFIPAAGQGIIAIECRKDDEETIDILNRISHKPTMSRLLIERDELKKLNVSCSDPVGIYYDGSNLNIFKG